MKINFLKINVCSVVMLAMSLVFSQTNDEISKSNESIKEGVLRYQMSKCLESDVTVVFLLSDHGKDFSDEFMERFKTEGVVVKKASARAESEATHEFIDKESGKIAVQLTIDKLKVTGDDAAEVEGSCGFASWAAKGYRYALIREKNDWIVKRSNSTWVF
jgi:hypothetical protein